MVRASREREEGTALEPDSPATADMEEADGTVQAGADIEEGRIDKY